MATITGPTYEVLALRYGIFDGRHAVSELHHSRRPRRAGSAGFLRVRHPRPIGAARTIVMDTGFNPVSATRRGRELLCTPAQALLNAGIDPAEVKDVVLTHMHWDHAGGMEYFPKAMFHIQAAEMAYCTGPCMCEPFLRRPFDVDDVQSAVRALYADRLRVYEGTRRDRAGHHACI